jgi:hypothetical protein
MIDEKEAEKTETPPMSASPVECGVSNYIGCPYTKEANQMCNVLVNEVIEGDTWARKSDAIEAILRVRAVGRNMAKEWEHINPSPEGCKDDC